MNESAVPAGGRGTVSRAQVGRVLCTSETIYPAVSRRVEVVPTPASEKAVPHAARAWLEGLKGPSTVARPGRHWRDGG